MLLGVVRYCEVLLGVVRYGVVRCYELTLFQFWSFQAWNE